MLNNNPNNRDPKNEGSNDKEETLSEEGRNKRRTKYPLYNTNHNRIERRAGYNTFGNEVMTSKYNWKIIK